MVATYTPTGRLTKQGTNDNPNTWGAILNAQVFTLLDEFIAGVADVDVTGSSNITLTTSNGATDEARHAILELTGTLGADIELLVPALDKKYFIRGAWSGAFTVTVKISGSSTSVAVRTGEKKVVYVNGTDIYDMVDTGLFVTSSDTTTANLDDKLTVSAPVVKTVVDPASDETLDLSVDSNSLLSGLGLQGGQNFTPAGAATTDIVFPISAFSSDDGVYMNFSSTLTKEIDSAWSAGDAAGGLDTGTVTSTATYFVFVIHNPTTNTTDGLFSLSSASPTMPSGYTKKRLMGYVQTESGALIDTWHIVWSAFGPFTAPTAWLMSSVNSSNVVQDVFFVFGTDPSSLGARVVLGNDGAVSADGDVTAFTSS